MRLRRVPPEQLLQFRLSGGHLWVPFLGPKIDFL